MPRRFIATLFVLIAFAGCSSIVQVQKFPLERPQRCLSAVTIVDTTTYQTIIAQTRYGDTLYTIGWLNRSDWPARVYLVRYNDLIGAISGAANFVDANMWESVVHPVAAATADTMKTPGTPAATTRGGATTDASGRVIHTGPRGGKYYINSNGNKTYVKKK